MKVNYYEILGVDRGASEQEIRDRFRKLARENHPDRYRGTDKDGAERKFQTLTEAVNVLTNADKRKQHDATLSTATSAQVDFTQIAKAYLAKGVKAYKEGDMRSAYENLDLATKHNPQDAKAFYNLAIVASRTPGKTREAVQAITTAVELDPMNATYLQNAGLFCKSAGLVAKAERYFEEALKWDAGNAVAQNALAELRQTKETAKGGFSIFGKR
jgi:DnaJ-class molecular chaperone